MSISRLYRSLLASAYMVTVFGLVAAGQTKEVQPRHLRTVWIIVMENQNWAAIKGSKSAPYINDTLLPMASHAEQYFNPPNNHPSLPNYIWIEAGTNFGIRDDLPPLAHSESTDQHLVALLRNAPSGAIEWRAYEEDISGTDCPLSSRYPYAVKHNPFVYFDDVTDRKNLNSKYCIKHVRPFSELARDLSNDTVARYNFITPNVCNDMHDSCAPLRDQIKQGDTWLSKYLPEILNSKAYRDGGVVFITWDEAEKADGPIGMVVLSPFARGRGYQNSIHYDHSSTLRTFEEIFGVTPYLGQAANQTDLGDMFSAFP
jgi:phospholipase C